MAPLDAEDKAHAQQAVSSLTEPDPDTGELLTLTVEQWRRLGDHLAELRRAGERGDVFGFRFHLGRIEVLSRRVSEVPGPGELPAPPDLVEERNALVTDLDLVLEPGRGAGSGDASRSDDQ
ncbi:CATRA system-associated protein [Streptomyces sp. NPDC005784]|uniref:CATRA system-associated protein n=1 Tax=Streptomyces sp. NPDC005784 TaxID=3364731 RepID=UPI00369F0870